MAAHRARRLARALAAMVAGLAAAWLLALLAVRADYRDADGCFDCWPHCSVLQDAVGATLFIAPLAAVLLVVAAVLLAALRPTSREQPPRSS